MTQMTLLSRDDSIDVQIGERVHQLMFRRRVTQTALAPAMGIGQSTLSGKLRGEVTWSARDIVNAARHLSTTSAYLLGETSDPRQGGPGGGVEYTAWDSNPEPTGSRHRLTAVTNATSLPERDPSDAPEHVEPGKVLPFRRSRDLDEAAS